LKRAAGAVHIISSAPATALSVFGKHRQTKLRLSHLGYEEATRPAAPAATAALASARRPF
jgi:hypothetical protein